VIAGTPFLPSASPNHTSTPTIGELWSPTWTRVHVPADSAIAWPQVAATDTGFLLIGAEANPSSTGIEDLFRGVVWASQDGVRWSRVASQGLESAFVLSGLATAPTGDLVLSGTAGFCAPHACPIRPDTGISMWISPDATTWRRIAFDSTEHGFITELITAGDVLIGIGTETGDGSTTIGHLWASTDGVAWELGETPADIEEIGGVAFHPGAFLALGKRYDSTREPISTLLLSTNGERWREIPEESRPPGIVTNVAATATDFYAFGAERNGSSVAIWQSADGEKWTKLGLDSSFDDAFFSEIAVASAGIVIAGDVSDSLTGEPRVWTSANGIDWARSDRLPEAPEHMLFDGAAASGDRVVLTGFAIGGPPGTRPQPTPPPSQDGLLTWLGQ
jgi:hypothetical protein